MNIGVDAGCLGIEDKRLKVGVYQLALNLFCQLGKIDKKNNYRLYTFNPILPRVMKKFGSRMENIVLWPVKGWMYLRLPIEFLSRKPDVFLALGQAMPSFHPFRTIGLVYDLAFEFFPDCYPKSLKKLRRNTKYLVKNADHLVTISKSSKKDLVQVYDVPNKKISVIYPGVSSIFKPKGEKQLFGKPYFLFVGALKRTKNIPFVLRSFARFLKKSKQGFYLVIVGGNLWLDPEIAKTIERFSLSKQVLMPGFIKEKDLPKFYRGATAFVSPSLYEGFGMTLLEAMACGCPVVTSKKGATVEVVGEAGILVDPTGEKELVEAMEKINNNEKLREAIIKRGLKQSEKFSWKKFAQGVLEVINENRHC